MLEDESNSQSTELLTKKLSSPNLLRNMGIMLVIAICIVIFLLIFRLLKCIALKDYRYYTIYMTVKEAIFFNLFIRFII